MKDKYKIEHWTLSMIVWYLILDLFGIVGLAFWVGVLIVPDSQFLIDNPVLHQGLMYALIIIDIGLVFFMLRIVIFAIFSKERLEEKNKLLEAEKIKRDKKVDELERELRRLQAEK